MKWPPENSNWVRSTFLPHSLVSNASNSDYFNNELTLWFLLLIFSPLLLAKFLALTLAISSQLVANRFLSINKTYQSTCNSWLDFNLNSGANQLLEECRTTLLVSWTEKLDGICKSPSNDWSFDVLLLLLLSGNLSDSGRVEFNGTELKNANKGCWGYFKTCSWIDFGGIVPAKAWDDGSVEVGLGAWESWEQVEKFRLRWGREDVEPEPIGEAFVLRMEVRQQIENVIVEGKEVDRLGPSQKMRLSGVYSWDERKASIALPLLLPLPLLSSFSFSLENEMVRSLSHRDSIISHLWQILVSLHELMTARWTDTDERLLPFSFKIPSSLTLLSPSFISLFSDFSSFQNTEPDLSDAFSSSHHSTLSAS